MELQNQLDLARSMAFQLEKQDVHEELLETQAMLQLASKQLSVASEHAELIAAGYRPGTEKYRHGKPTYYCRA